MVFKIAAKQKLTEVRAAFRYQIPVPPTSGCDFHTDISTDKGKTWTTFATAEIPADNEFSSGWLSGKHDVSGVDCKSALVRFHMSTPGRNAALIDAQLYGVHEVAPPEATAVEFGWMEGDQLRTQETVLAAKVTSTKLHVPTSKKRSRQFRATSSAAQSLSEA